MPLVPFLLRLFFMFLVAFPALGFESRAVARSSGGLISHQDLNDFQRCQPSKQASSLERWTEALVIQRSLRDSFREQHHRNTPAFRAGEKYLRAQVVANRLRKAMAEGAAPSEAEMKLYYAGNSSNYRRPKRWRLENLFKRFSAGASEPQKEVLRRNMEDLRLRLLAGESFAELAATESESQTRVRNGRMGIVALKDLSPEIAAVVAELETEDLSPVIETSAGLTLLRCTETFDPEEPTFEKVRERILKRLKKQRLSETWQELEAELGDELRPQIHPMPSFARGKPDTIVVSWKGLATPETLSIQDVEFFLERKGARPIDQLTSERLRELLDERLTLELLAFESKRRSLTKTKGFLEQLGCELAKLEAQTALQHLAGDHFEPPSEVDIRRGRAQMGARLEKPGLVHLQVFEVPIDPRKPPELYEQILSKARTEDEGQLSLNRISAAFQPHGEFKDLGWLTEDQAWLLGRGVELALKDLEPGQTSAPVQEGKRFLFIHLVGREVARPMNGEEARSQVLSLLTRKRQRQAENLVRAAILKQQRIEYLGDASAE